MQNNFKKIPLILAAMFFIVFSLTFFFLYKEVNSNNEKTEQSIVELENDVNQRSKIETLNHSIEMIRGDKVLVESHFAKSSDIVPFLDALEALAPRAEVKAEVASVDILKDGTGLLVGIKASGSFENLYKFLMLLENFPYELEFIAIDMQKETLNDVPSDMETESGSGVPKENINIQKSKWQAILSVKLLSFVK